MARLGDPVRQCIAGIERTIEAAREGREGRAARDGREAREDMVCRPTLFLLGIEAVGRAALMALARGGSCDLAIYSSVQTFIDTYDPERPGCIILDIAMMASHGFELQQTLGSQGPIPPIIILGSEGPLPPISRGFTLGPVAFVRKPVDVSELRRAVTTAVAQDQEARCRVSLIDELQGRAAQLTKQEHEVMGLMVQGVAQKQIAAKLKISTRTVQLRRSRIMRKMHAESLAELVQFSLILNSTELNRQT
jgi:two-component system response regulator FixJ